MNTPRVVSVNRGSLNAVKSIDGSKPSFLGVFFQFFSIGGTAVATEDEVMVEDSDVGDEDAALISESRARMSQFANTISNRQTKPTILTAQPKPTFGVADCIISGNTIPPIEPPVVATPVAYPRFSRNQWPIEATAGVKTKDVPMPPSIYKPLVLHTQYTYSKHHTHARGWIHSHQKTT